MLPKKSKPTAVYVWLPPAVIVATDGLRTKLLGRVDSYIEGSSTREAAVRPRPYD